MTRPTALITGGAGGLGHPVTALFVARGWRVVAPLRPGTDPGRLPPGAEPAEADLAEPDAVAAVAAQAASDPAAPLRAVINLAGGFAAGKKIHQLPVAQFEEMFAVNLRPTYLVTAAALPHLVAAGGGAVVCVAAEAARRPFPGAAGYISAKAAVLAFAHTVAVEYAGAGVRCNTVLPALIDTPGNRAAMPDADRSRWVPPAQIASVIHFLAGPESAPTTAAALPVTGGS